MSSPHHTNHTNNVVITTTTTKPMKQLPYEPTQTISFDDVIQQEMRPVEHFPLSLAIPSILGGTAFGSSLFALFAPIYRISLITQTSPELVVAGKLNAPYKNFIETLRDPQNKFLRKTGFRGASALSARAFIVSSMAAFARLAVTHNDLPDAFNTPAATTATFLGLIATYPLSLVYTRLAADVPNARPAAPFAPLPGQTQPKVSSPLHPAQANQFFYKSPRECFKGVLKTEGVRGLFRGATPAIASYLAIALAYMIAKNLGNKCSDSRTFAPLELSENNLKILQFTTMMTLSLSLTAIPFILYPLETLSNRMMMSTMTGSNYTSARDCLTQVIHTEGRRSLYRGVLFSVIFCSGFKTYPDESGVYDSITAFLKNTSEHTGINPDIMANVVISRGNNHKIHD